MDARAIRAMISWAMRTVGANSDSQNRRQTACVSFISEEKIAFRSPHPVRGRDSHLRAHISKPVNARQLLISSAFSGPVAGVRLEIDEIVTGRKCELTLGGGRRDKCHATDALLNRSGLIGGSNS
jgi:hypothetical protein